MSEVTTQAKPERRKRQKLEDMEGYKPSIYGLTRDELIDWAMEHGERNSVLLKFGIGSTRSVCNLSKK